MKLIQGIFGCALVAGLTTFVSVPAQAGGTVIGNTVFTPLNIKLKVQYTDSKGKVHEAGVTSKDLLKLIGAAKGNQLATDYDGFGDEADVFLIDKDSVIADLSSDSIFYISFNQLVSKYDKGGKNGSFSEAERGIVSMEFDSSYTIYSGVQPLFITPEDYVTFEATGVYTWQESGGAIKNGDQKISTNLSVSKVIGSGFDSSLTPTIQPKEAPSGGSYLIKDGSASGSGGGTVNVIEM